MGRDRYTITCRADKVQQVMNVFQTLDPSFFRCLRAIRDAHKNQVSYIVITTDELARLRDDLTKVEHFYRLVSRNVCGPGPYGETYARQMVRYLASQHSTAVIEGDIIHLIELSGGHTGLLKAILSLIWRYNGPEGRRIFTGSHRDLRACSD